MNTEHSRILICGADGKTGRAVLGALAAQSGLLPRAWVRHPSRAASALELGAADVTTGDLTDPAAWKRAVHGCSALYLICPNVHPLEAVIGHHAIDACRASGVRRLVYHSVLHPQTRGMPHHRRKLEVEELLLESGLETTILQPAPYFQNLLAYWPGIVGEGTLPVPYDPGARTALVDLEDVAEVAARVLVEDRDVGAIYSLCGEAGDSMEGVADRLSAVLGHPVRAQEVSRSDWARDARDRGLDDARCTTLLSMFAYYESYGLVGNARTLEWLLEREPTHLEAFVRRTVKVT